MRSFVVAIGLVLAFVVGGPIACTEEQQREQQSQAGPIAQREREMLTGRPSGFWTSTRPANGDRYRWRLLGIGVVLAAGAGVLMWQLVKRANAERERRAQQPDA